MWRFKGHWIGLLWLTLAFSVKAQDALPSPPDNQTDYAVKRWTTEDGLPQNRIACLQQTRDGYLWIGTWFGLARFDGACFTVFNQGNTPAFASDPSNTINALAEDTAGSLWIGTSDGLIKYRNGRFQRFTVSDGLPDPDIRQLAAAAAGGIWLQAGDKIVRERHDQFVDMGKPAADQRISNLEEDANGHLNVFCANAWLDLAEDGRIHTNNLYQAKTLFPNGETYSGGVLAQPAAALLATAEGIRLVRKNETNPGFVGGKWRSATGIVLREATGTIWAQSRTEGLRRFAGAHWQPVDLGKFRSDITCGAQDAQGNVWLGTAGGLVQLQFPKVRVFTTQNGLPDDDVWTVCQSADGAIWAGTDHGPAILKNNLAEAAAVFTNGSAGSIHCVWPARAGGVWVASQNEGIARLQNGRVVEQIKGAGLPGALFEDTSGRLWMATSDGSVRCFQNGTLEKAPVKVESLKKVCAMNEDHSGNLWFGARDELAQWQGGKLAIFGRPNGLPPGRIFSIHEDADGVLWLGTETGLVRFAHGNFFPFTAQQEMPADTVNCVLEDDRGGLWLSTLHGIYQAGRGQLNAVADGKAATVQPFIVGTADGLKTAESNGEVQPAGWKARDGRLWFPTGKGLAVIDPGLFLEQTNPPPVLFESLKADGNEFFHSANAKIKIPAGGGHALTFQFTACDLAAPGQVRFRTRLDGVDRDWTAPTLQRRANYFDLPPGNYRLEVAALDHHGRESAPAALEFSIAPFFWQTPWFYVLGMVAVLTTGAWVQAYRLRWQRRLFQLEQQRALANERARIARDLHDDLGTALTGMALELDVLGRDPQSHAAFAERLAKSSQHARHLAERMREVVWVVNPRCDNLRSLADFLEDQAALLLPAAGLQVRLEFPVEIPDLTVAANVRHQLALSVREAFTNLIRHARASEAEVRLELADEKLLIGIRDNGCGFDVPAQLEKPHGLMNLKSRLAEIGGEFKCVSRPGSGTTVIFQVPLSKLKATDQKL
ncbi:MAG TPA: two-component regulator propeller domain-containing protein [Verrucomicrobiae bacterium]|jgi:signal transduction histidine kinase/ligand-binding sensor domain-containing protein